MLLPALLSIQSAATTARQAYAWATPPLLSPRSVGAAETPRAYAARIAAVLTVVQQAEHEAGLAREHALAAARALLSPSVPVPVRLGGLTIQADLSSVRRDLITGRLARAEQRLAALHGALAAPSARAAAPDTRRLAALDAILRRPPFTTPPTLWDSIRQFLQGSPLGAVWSFITNLWTTLLGSAADSAAVPIVAGVIAALALLFAASRLFGRVVPQTGVDESLENPLLARLDAPAARSRAATLAAAGEYREAARYLFLATLLALDEAGLVRIDEATGNRDVLRQARATPRLAEALSPVVRGFDRFWFGHVPLTREDYEGYQQLTERVLRETR